MEQQDFFASTQLLAFNPILKETIEIRTQYFQYLKKIILLVKWDKCKYTKAQIAFYRETLCGDGVPFMSKENKIPTYMSYLLPYDLALMVAFHPKLIHVKTITTIIDQIIRDFDLPKEHACFLYYEFEAALGNPAMWNEILESKIIQNFKQYITLVKANIDFIQKKPSRILITATMSAGKSTLINSLTGKTVCRMQNMACTSKIHTIISKAFEDSTTSEYDHDLLMNATKEDLFANNEENLSSKITVGTYFNSALGGERIILLDSPGVNSSEYDEHRKISNEMLHSKEYKLVLYVMNATQLGTNDEKCHLNTVKKEIGRTKVIFVINKIDQFLSEDDNLFDVIENQRRFLAATGFSNPIICPVSARAAYLVRKSKQEELTQIERRELDTYIDKFDQHSMATYYEKHLKCPSLSRTTDESTELLKNCGFAYLEQIIKHFSNGGIINGTDLC